MLCFTAGGSLALAFAPYHFFPVLWVALPLFFLALQNAPTPRAAGARGFAFGYGFSIAGTHWIANALLVDAEQFGWLYPISVLGLSALMASFWALLGWVYARVRTASLLANALRFAVLWGAMEYLRSVGMLGFPWNMLGSAALASPALAQPIAVLGSYGMSLLLALIGLAPALCLSRTLAPALRLGYALCALALLLGCYGYGLARLPTRADVPLTPTRLRLVQANIPQSMKWTQQGAMESMALHRAMTTEPAHLGAPAPDLILWPETALPFTLFPASNLPEQLATLLPPHARLITGALRVEGDRDHERLFNSVAVIGAESGTLEATYDKHHLVPFGEFIPFEQWLPLERITHGKGSFAKGQGSQTLSLGDGIPPFSPLICYEVIFPWEAVSPTHRPEWILNLTNDAWYGDSAGPYQHFDTARLRALEQGLPLVRVANTGISAMIDPYGRPLQRMALGTRGFLDAALPAPLPPTPYARLGEWPCLILMGLIWAMAGLVRKKKH